MKRFTPEKLSRARSRDQGADRALVANKKKSVGPPCRCAPACRGARTRLAIRRAAAPARLAIPREHAPSCSPGPRKSARRPVGVRGQARAEARGRGLGRRSLATNPLPARSTNAPTTLHCTLHLVVPGRPPSPPAHVPWFHAAQLPLARLLRRPERVNATRAIVAEANDTMPSTAEQLMKLAEMKEKGLLDTKEFIDQKAIVCRRTAHHVTPEDRLSEGTAVFRLVVTLLTDLFKIP